MFDTFGEKWNGHRREHTVAKGSIFTYALVYIFCNEIRLICVLFLLWAKIEIEIFMKGGKRAVVLSGTASTGLDLHASLVKGCTNKQQRHHITMEVGWAPEMLLQQLGMVFIL